METQVKQPDSKAHNLLMGRGSSSRAIKDKLTQIGVTIGGAMVFIALLLIFFYLLYVIKPIFDDAEVSPVSSVDLHDSVPALMVGSDEQNEIMYRVSQTGRVDFYDVSSSKLIETEQLEFP
ncbi:MAG: phosphate ABC transporter permease, partial [Shewanella sp.]|nr:phosphate ABC transporter permease [Shewanella sp.]